MNPTMQTIIEFSEKSKKKFKRMRLIGIFWLNLAIGYGLSSLLCFGTVKVVLLAD